MPINTTQPSADDYQRTFDQQRAYIEELEAERDALRATVQRVEGLAEEGMSSSCIHVNDLVVNLRAALHPEEPHTPAQDASSGPDGPEGAGSGNKAQGGVSASEGVTLVGHGEKILGQRWRKHPVDEPPVIRAKGRTLYQEAWERDGWTVLEPCGDRLTTWHGPIGPCVLTGRHELHDDGGGVTWARSNVPDVTGGGA